MVAIEIVLTFLSCAHLEMNLGRRARQRCDVQVSDLEDALGKLPASHVLQAVAETAQANGYGLRSSTARPVAKSTGTEACICTISHLPPIFWKQAVQRSQFPTLCP